MTLWKRIVCFLTGCFVEPAETSTPAQADDGGARLCGAGRGERPAATRGDQASESSAGPWYALPEATLLEPQPVTCPEMSHETRAIMGGLECTLENQEVELPPIPRVPEAVLRCLSSRNCDFSEVAELISEDASTTTRVLRMANAALWGVRATNSIPEAVVRLGTRPLQSLMMSESLMVASCPSRKSNRVIAQRFWDRSLAAGCLMRALAPLCKIDPEEAFVMGLLHDVGDVVVLRAVDRYEALSHSPIETDAFEYLCYKFHGSLGALVGDKWSLSPTLKSLLTDHHSWPEAQDPHRVERLLLMLTDMINQMIGYSQPALYNLPQSRPVQELGLAGQEQFLSLLEPLPEQIRERVDGIN